MHDLCITFATHRPYASKTSSRPSHKLDILMMSIGRKDRAGVGGGLDELPRPAIVAHMVIAHTIGIWPLLAVAISPIAISYACYETYRGTKYLACG